MQRALVLFILGVLMDDALAAGHPCSSGTSLGPTFLTGEDVGNFKLVQSTPIDMGGGGQSGGVTPIAAEMHVWTASTRKQELQDIRDFRLAFVSEKAAAEFVDTRTDVLAEGAPRMASMVFGSVDVQVYGPRNAKARALARSLNLPESAFTGYAYIFQIGNIVAKVFLFQNSEAENQMKAGDYAYLVERAVSRVAHSCQSNSAISKPQAAAPLAELIFQAGHVINVVDIDFSADGKLLATGSADETLKLWEVQTARQLRTFIGSHGPIYAVRFSPDGRLIAAGGWDRRIRIWEANSGDLSIDLGDNPHDVVSIAWSPDGKRLAGGTTDYRKDGQSVSVWDATSGKKVVSLPTSGTNHGLAFSPNGDRLAVGGDADNAVMLFRTSDWMMVERIELPVDSGAVGNTSRESETGIRRIAWSADSARIAVLRGHNVYAITEARAEAAPKRLTSKEPVNDLSLVRDGNLLLLESAGIERLVGIDGPTVGITPAADVRAVSPTGQIAVRLENLDRTVVLLDAQSGRELATLKSGLTDKEQFGNLTRYFVVASSPRAPLLAVGGLDKVVHVWDLASGGAPRDLQFGGRIEALDFDSKGDFLAAGGNGAVTIWRTDDWSLARKLDLDSRIRGLAFNRTGEDKVAVLTDDSVAILSGAGFGAFRKLASPVKKGMGDGAVAWSADDVLMIGGGGDVAFRSGDKVNSLSGITDEVDAVAVNREGRWAVGGGISKWMYFQQANARLDKPIILFDSSADVPVKLLYGHQASVRAIAFDPLGNLLASGGSDGALILWDVTSGKQLAKFPAHGGDVTGLAFTQTGRYLASVGMDGSTRLWSMASLQPIASLAVRNGDWIVSTPDGHFDTNDLEEVKSMQWVMRDDPLHALPVEIFMRDYYEPRLLPQLLAGKRFSNARSLSELNRAQPEVRIVGVEREAADGKGAASDTVRVTVEVSGVSQEFGLDGQRRRMHTGVYDLRLFRDGQLVGQCPGEAAGQCPAGKIEVVTSGSSEEELSKWRRQRLVARLEEGKKRIVFGGIRLPRVAGLKEVQFSAYAFNDDRVKSETSRERYLVPPDLKPRAARAYVVTIGVNAFQDPRWDLSYAVHDAEESGHVLKERLESLTDQNGRRAYERVVWVSLIADLKNTNSNRQITPAHADKAHIRAALQTLAGQSTDTDVLAEVEGSEELARANPEDLVIITISTHGIVDTRGLFYFLPSDIGAEPSTQAMFEHAVSSEELSEWLRSMDARDQVMIVDACRSAASVQEKDFKPAPLGSRGLGQLAYDKGMRILAASQVDQYALETAGTRLGLLTHALMKEGLEQNKADYRPHDGRILLSEWLNYATERVPVLYQQWETGRLRTVSQTKGLVRGQVVLQLDAKSKTLEDTALQLPALFDFTRGRDVLIASSVSHSQ